MLVFFITNRAPYIMYGLLGGLSLVQKIRPLILIDDGFTSSCITNLLLATFLLVRSGYDCWVHSAHRVDVTAVLFLVLAGVWHTGLRIFLGYIDG